MTPPANAGGALGPRLVTAAAGIPLVVGATLAGGIPFLILIEILAFLGTVEMHRLAGQKGLHPHRIVGVAGALAVVAAAYFLGEPGAAALLTGALVITLTAGLARRTTDGILADGAVTLLGVLYLGWFGAHFCLLRNAAFASGGLAPGGARLLLLVFATTWVCDTAAYAFGMAFGKHRLFPHASPKKSVEGTVAGLLGAIVAAYAFRGWLAPSLTHAQTLGIALAVGAIGQAGDFAESLIKRDAGIKDTSRWLPGHGGVLDRFDSLLVSVPVIYYIMKFTG